jgi:ABC-type polysaccharide/polyol phosphate transport system ATPase subunit
MSIAVKVENLGKRYLIKHQSDVSYDTFREIISQKTKSFFRKNNALTSQFTEEFWALKDVNFEIEKGDRLGIIGKNGAGKSTMLKILSRITEQTTGKISIKGRIASLLEVGTGFHPELTGRENIFLNGSILGMRKAEIKSKFDEIVSFAGTEKFLDTPVKRYSSGMYVRLAFAVAAHLESEILILDEVLAVGDAEFQKKCLRKIEDVSKSGRTIIYVSHNISSVRSLCTKAILMEKGFLKQIGIPEKVIPFYVGAVKEGNINDIKVKAVANSVSGEWEQGSYIDITVSWDPYKFKPGWQCDISCYSVEGTKIFALESEKFDDFSSSDEAYNSITFHVLNTGFVNADMRLDVGIKEKAEMPYCIVIENCLTLSPSDKNLPSYRRNDVITIPAASCTAKKI